MDTTDRRQAPAHPSSPLYKRVLWFGLLYVASLGAFTAVVYALRGMVPH